MSALPPITDIHQRGLHVRLVPEADIQVLGPDSCSTLLSSIEIIREFRKAVATTRLLRQSRKDGRERKDAELPAFRLRAAADPKKLRLIVA